MPRTPWHRDCVRSHRSCVAARGACPEPCRLPSNGIASEPSTASGQTTGACVLLPASWCMSLASSHHVPCRCQQACCRHATRLKREPPGTEQACCASCGAGAGGGFPVACRCRHCLPRLCKIALPRLRLRTIGCQRQDDRRLCLDAHVMPLVSRVQQSCVMLLSSGVLQSCIKVQAAGTWLQAGMLRTPRRRGCGRSFRSRGATRTPRAASASAMTWRCVVPWSMA